MPLYAPLCKCPCMPSYTRIHTHTHMTYHAGARILYLILKTGFAGLMTARKQGKKIFQSKTLLQYPQNMIKKKSYVFTKKNTKMFW